jgi:hypothetical protein
VGRASDDEPRRLVDLQSARRDGRQRARLEDLNQAAGSTPYRDRVPERRLTVRQHHAPSPAAASRGLAVVSREVVEELSGSFPEPAAGWSVLVGEDLTERQPVLQPSDSTSGAGLPQVDELEAAVHR